MQKFNKIVMLSLAAVLALGVASGCGPTGGGELGDYTPRFPTDYDENINSWEQVDPADEDVTITWFFDYGIADENLEDLIYQRTGVNVNIQSASTNNHEEINTMISDNRLPDVITLSDSSLRILLAEEGYCLPLNQLAQYYAPGIVNSIGHRFYKGIPTWHTFNITRYSSPDKNNKFSIICLITNNVNIIQ